MNYVKKCKSYNKRYQFISFLSHKYIYLSLLVFTSVLLLDVSRISSTFIIGIPFNMNQNKQVFINIFLYMTSTVFFK